MKCAKCGREIADGADSCDRCGIVLVHDCPTCGHINAGDAIVCGECGNLLATNEEQVTSPTPREGERKQVTALFSDLTNYTAICERLDPEEVGEMMSRILGEISQIVIHCGGIIEHVQGDGVLALFGVPKAHEDDPLRAVRAAKEIHAAVEGMNAFYEKKVGLHLSMHSGINSGVVVTSQADAGPGSTRVSGDAVNVASRLSDLASPGEILVGVDTYRLTAPFFTFETLPRLRVKGKTDPLTAYRVLELKETSRRVRFLSALGISSPLVGRAVEFETIKGCVERLEKGEGGLLFVIGDAGIGKSRLMAEIRALVCSETGRSFPRFLEGRAASFGQTISYLPFREILWEHAGITEDDSDTRAWQKLEKAGSLAVCR